MFSLHIDWVQINDFPINPYYMGDKGRVILMGGFCNNFKAFHTFKKSDVIISLSLSDHNHEDYTYARRMIEAYEFDVKRVFFFCNSKAETKRARECGLAALFCNQNAFLNEKIFKYEPTTKIYDAVSNSRMIKWKRVPLASKIGNLVIIAGHNLEVADYDDPRQIPHTKLYEGNLNSDEVRDIVLQSRVGVILSEKEGACMASSEFLMCGVPVVSTYCSGGREIWYNDHNSILCEPTMDGVADSVKLMISKLESGEVNPEKIQKDHSDMAKIHKRTFVETLEQAFRLINVNIDADKYYLHNYRLWDRDRSLSYEQVCKIFG